MVPKNSSLSGVVTFPPSESRAKYGSISLRSAPVMQIETALPNATPFLRALLPHDYSCRDRERIATRDGLYYHMPLATGGEMRIPRTLACLILAGITIQFVSAQSALWNRAVALSASSNGYVPGTMISTMEELNNDGSVKSTFEAVYALSDQRGTNKPEARLIRATRDGKDVTAEMAANGRNNNNGSRGSGGGFGFNGLLFDQKALSKIHFLPGTSWQLRDGRRIASIPFAIDTNGKGKMSGVAEIDETTGIPIVAHLKAHFPFVSGLVFDLHYRTLSSGDFVLSTMSFEGSVSLLFLKRAFHGTMEFTDYHRPPG